jgi:FkbM family methyltransferase
VAYFADKEVGGVTGWHWTVGDTGAWDGPARDWETSHVDRIVGRMIISGRTGLALQAGGCNGMYPRLLSSVFERVITLEPDPTSFEALTLNCSGLDNVFKFQAALGDSPSTVSMIVQDPTNVGMNRVSEGGVIPRITIDSLGASPDLIWLDIEGHEVEALRGSIETIRRSRPTIVVENPGPKFNDVMSSVGYELVDRSVADGIYERTT